VPLVGQQVVQQFVEDVAALRRAGIVIVLPADKDFADVDTLIQAPVVSLWGRGVQRRRAGQVRGDGPSTPKDVVGLGGLMPRPAALAAGVVGDDRGEVGLGEAAVHCGVPEGPVDRDRVTELGQRDSLRHLHPHLGAAGRGGLGQPQPRAAAEGQKLSLLGVLGPRSPVQRPGRLGWEVRVEGLRAAWGGAAVPGDLDRAVGPDVHVMTCSSLPCPCTRTQTC